MISGFLLADTLGLSALPLSPPLLDGYEPAGAGMALVFEVVEIPLATR
jgi:hypothetical protein